MNHSNFAGEICSFTRTDKIKILYFVSMRIINAIASHWVGQLMVGRSKEHSCSSFCGPFAAAI
jgi:hypothetical protein